MANARKTSKMTRFKRWLFQDVDNSGLILWRILLGFLLTAEAWGAILTGWMKETYVDPSFRFHFIGFDFLQILSGEWMYIYNIVMGVFGLMFMLGYRYRLAAIGYFIMWSGIYFGQKSNYNNHYYLLLLLVGIMIFIPANRFASLDAKSNPSIKSYSAPRWAYFILQLQFAIVYVFATVAKLYPDWLKAIPVSLWLNAKSDYWLIGPLLTKEWLHYFMSYAGIFYDGTIILFLLFKRTRVLALVLSLIFHLSNSAIFQIGVFPFMAISAILLFWDPAVIRKRFFKKKPAFITPDKQSIPNWSNAAIVVVGIYFIWQVYLPLRHHLYEGNVHWTEEGHRLSWQMMTRSKRGSVFFYVKLPDSSNKSLEFPAKRIAPHQAGSMATRPDMIWQYAQHLKEIYQDSLGVTPQVYAHSSVSLNGRPSAPLVNSKVDLAAEPWNRFEHKHWILLMKD